MKKIYLLATVAILAFGCGSNSESKTDEIIASKDIKKIKEQRELINKELKIWHFKRCLFIIYSSRNLKIANFF
jgi:hypothetical protein